MERTFILNNALTNTGRQGLAFYVRSVLVDNSSTQWVYIPANGQYVPPGQVGFIANLQVGTPVIQAMFQTPPGQTTNALAGQATIIFTDQPYPANPGTPTTFVAPTSALTVVSVGVPTNSQSNGVVTVPIPAAAQSGDLLLAFMGAYNNASAVLLAYTIAAGWTVVSSRTQANGAATQSMRAEWARNTFQVGMANPTFTFTNSASIFLTAVIIVVRNANSTTPILGTTGGAASTVAAATLAIAGATGAVNGAIAFYGVCFAVSNASNTLTSWVPALTIDCDFGASGAGIGLEIGHVGLTSSGFGPTETITIAANWSVMAFGMPIIVGQ